MIAVALFRNLNQGQHADPTSAALTAAFLDAGAERVSLVRGNGTALFEARDVEAVVSRVRDDLAPWRDAVFVRDAVWLGQVLADIAEADRIRTELTLFSPSLAPAVTVPHEGKACRIARIGSGFAVVVNEAPGVSNGTPTIEKLLGAPATSRNLSTIAMVMRRYAVWSSGGGG